MQAMVDLGLAEYFDATPRLKLTRKGMAMTGEEIDRAVYAALRITTPHWVTKH